MNPLKNISVFLLLALIPGLNACSKKCDSVGCIGFAQLREVTIEDYGLTEVDSVVLETFEDNFDKSNRTDSILLTLSNDVLYTDSIETITYLLPYTVFKSLNYRLTVLSDSGQFEITAFQTSFEECNCPEDKYEVLKGYQVNGILKSDSRLSLLRSEAI